MSENLESHSKGLYYVIPSAIMDSDDLNPGEKLLYALLSGFAHSNGTCFPSDAYLAKRLHENERTVQRWIKKLADLGYISKIIKSCPSNPFKKIRVITVHADFKKPSPQQKNDSIDTDKFVGLGTTPVSVIVSKEEIVSEESRERALSACETHAPPPEKPPVFFEVGKVKMLKSDYLRLVDSYGTSTVEATVKQLDLYSQIDPSKFKKYKNHSAVVESWILRDAKKGDKSWNKQKISSTKSMACKPVSSANDTPEQTSVTYDLTAMLRS